MHKASLHDVIATLLLQNYPLKIDEYRIAKVVLPHTCTYYLFWAWMKLQEPKEHLSFQHADYAFVFGQIFLQKYEISSFECKEIDFYRWALIANKRGWFDLKNVSQKIVSYKTTDEMPKKLDV